MAQMQKRLKCKNCNKPEKTLHKLVVFFTKLKKSETEIFAFCVITFGPIRI